MAGLHWYDVSDTATTNTIDKRCVRFTVCVHDQAMSQTVSASLSGRHACEPVQLNKKHRVISKDARQQP